ncbi:Ig-like domain-containing protein, partial [Streptococcus equinus]|uniref:Ig-like domain-containing protein n=1 Tax=Streptococcus equinus TaxID=1335 RepID=UPI0008D1A821
MKRTEKLLVAAVAFSGLTLAAGQVAADTNAPTYSVTIPATVNLADSNPVATIKAEGVSIDTTRYTPISVKLAQASNTIKGSTFHLREAKTNDTLSYNIRKNRRNVSVGDTVARFTSDGETTLNFTKPEAADYAGSYTENLTFDISVSPNSNYVPVTSVSINSAPSTLNVGATGTLTATVGPEDATDKTVTWASGNPDVLVIDATTGA